MNSPPFRYAVLLAAVEATPDPSEVALIATAYGVAHDPAVGPWFQAAVRGRYQDFTRPGWPDGPHSPRPYLVR